MNTPDSITITITRGRWSVSRCMDLDLMDGATLDASEELYSLYEETRHAFTLACTHLPEQFNAPQNVPRGEPAKTHDGRTIICPRCNQAMARTSAGSWCCYPCREVWSIMKDPPPGPGPESEPVDPGF